MKKKTNRIVAFLVVLVLSALIVLPSGVMADTDKKLVFHEDGTFKIMMMSDFQDYINEEKPNVNPKSIELMNAALEQEKPDLVVMAGDMLGGDMNAEQLQDYIQQMVAPLEEHKVPWLITYGNHDEDAKLALEDGWNKIKQLEYYRSFEYNINEPSMSGVEGFEPNGKNTFAVGDMYVLVYDNAGEKPLYNVWALDSNRYDVSGTGLGGYDWIRYDQIAWYYNTSKALEEEHGLLNSLMFYHIPTPEWAEMRANALTYNVTGHKNENECPPRLNSGLFAAALERGDVRGMFVGHDHVNDYVGNYLGIVLGYDANVGFETYGLSGDARDQLRGVRVFELDQKDLSTFETRMVYAVDLGIQ